MGDIIAIIVLGLAVISLLVDRYFYTQRMHKQLDDILKAALSRNISEYLSAKKADEPVKVKKEDDEYVPLEEADDETFNKFIKSNESTK